MMHWQAREVTMMDNFYRQMAVFLQWNIRGLQANREELNILVSCINPSVICLQKTFLKSRGLHSKVFPISKFCIRNQWYCSCWHSYFKQLINTSQKIRSSNKSASRRCLCTLSENYNYMFHLPPYICVF